MFGYLRSCLLQVEERLLPCNASKCNVENTCLEKCKCIHNKTTQHQIMKPPNAFKSVDVKFSQVYQRDCFGPLVSKGLLSTRDFELNLPDSKTEPVEEIGMFRQRGSYQQSTKLQPTENYFLDHLGWYKQHAKCIFEKLHS